MRFGKVDVGKTGRCRALGFCLGPRKVGPQAHGIRDNILGMRTGYNRETKERE